MDGLETFFNASRQGSLFLISCLFGAPIGVFFDCFRAIRLLLPHNRLLVALEDLLFCFGYALFLICFTYTAARGDFRIFYVIGNGLGFAIYYCTAGTVVVGVIRRIATVLRRMLFWILRPFRALTALICEKTRPFFVRSLQKFRKTKKTAGNGLPVNGNMMYNKHTKRNRRAKPVTANRNKNKSKGM